MAERLGIFVLTCCLGIVMTPPAPAADDRGAAEDAAVAELITGLGSADYAGRERAQAELGDQLCQCVFKQRQGIDQGAVEIQQQRIKPAACRTHGNGRSSAAQACRTASLPWMRSSRRTVKWPRAICW